MKPRLWQLLTVVCSFAALGAACAGTRTALVGQGNGGVENVLDMATALLGKDADLELLDRAEVDRVLREQKFSPGGIVGADHAVSAGRLLQADLFAVLEGTLTNETGGSASFGLVVFDAKTGARYFDSALSASNTVSAAAATAAAVRAAVAKSRLNAEVLHTVGVLRVRNADLPRQLDSLCDSVGLLLERELTASPGIAVLERRRLEQVNKERSLAPDAEGNRLLASVRMIELDIARDGEGLRGTLALVGVDGTRTNGITASVPIRSAADLAHLLADKMEQFLNVPADGNLGNGDAEAGRFHREYLLLLQHHDYFAAVRALDAALALSPAQTGWQAEMALLLPFAAIELVDHGGQNWGRQLAVQPSVADLTYCLALGQRGADLVLDLSRAAAAAAKPGGPIPDLLKETYRERLCQLLRKLADVETSDAACVAGITAINATERVLRMDVLESFMAKRVVDTNSFASYSTMLDHWFLERSGFRPEGWLQDDLRALQHWVELSHKFNPPDGSGIYFPIAMVAPFGFFAKHHGSEIEAFRKTLEQDPDAVIRVHARAGRVAASMKPTDYPSDETLAAEHEFRLQAQAELVEGEAAQPGPLREHTWRAIKDSLDLLLNHNECGQEFLDACRFAVACGEIRPALFSLAFVAFESPRHRNMSQELEVVAGTLKLILEKPEAYPDPGRNVMWQRKIVIVDLQKRHERLTAELAGANPNVPAPSPWAQQVCLLDLTAPINGLAWLFKPMVEDGQVYALALGFHEWGLAEDSVQLIRVPLAGGPPSFLGRAKISVTDWVNRPYVLGRGPKSRLTDETPTVFVPVGRAACVGGGCYFAATCSGVYIFPTNGGPVVHLGLADELPSEDVHAVAFLDGKLYIGAGEVDRGGYLAVYDPDSRKLTILASSRRSEHISPFDDQPPFCTFGLTADTARHRLLMTVSMAIIPSNKVVPVNYGMGIWAYLPASGAYHQLVPLRLPIMSPLLQGEGWAAPADANTLAVRQGGWTLALFDFRNDRLLPSYDVVAARTNAALAGWRSPVSPGGSRLGNGPFLLRVGWLYTARPFGRMALADGRREEFPSLRTDYPFEPRESLQLMDDGKHVLAADQFSLWLLELRDEPAQAAAGKAGAGSTSIKQ